MAHRYSYPTQSSLPLRQQSQNNLSSSAKQNQNKISRRQNARMQLAAALIEADNDSVPGRPLEKPIAASSSSGARLSTVPQPKLASESAIFAPFRAGYTGESAQEEASADVQQNGSVPKRRSIQRPQSVDFLGVNLPGERRPTPDQGMNTAAADDYCHSGLDVRPQSVSSLARSSPHSVKLDLSRPQSMVERSSSAASSNLGESAETLSAWGMERYLSSEARQQVAEERERKRSDATSYESDPLQPGQLLGRARRASEISITRSVGSRPTSPEIQIPMRRPTMKGRTKSDVGRSSSRMTRPPDLELLAKIKKYREQRDEFPPSHWTNGIQSAAAGASNSLPATPDQPELELKTSLIDNVSPVSAAQSPLAQTALAISIDQLPGLTSPPPKSPSAIEAAASEGLVARDRLSHTPMIKLDFPREGSIKGFTGDSWSEAGSDPVHAGIPKSIGLQGAATVSKLSWTSVDTFDATEGQRETSEEAKDAIDQEFVTTPPASTSLAEPRTPRSPVSKRSSAHFEALASLQGDYFGAVALADGPYPSAERLNTSPSRRFSQSVQNVLLSPIQSADSAFIGQAAQLSDNAEHLETPRQQARLPSPGASMSTKQLQELARRSQFPEHLSMLPPQLEVDEESEEQPVEEAFAKHLASSESFQRYDSLPSNGWVPEKSPGLLSKAFRPVSMLFGGKPVLTHARTEPDLSSMKWKSGKQADYLLSVEDAVDGQDGPAGRPVPLTPELAALEDDELYRTIVDSGADVDDDFISPPMRGPLKPQGVDARLPEKLIMPLKLEGSAVAPRTKLVELDDADSHRRSRSLASDDSSALRAVAKTKLPFVPPAPAPKGIGRRASMPSTALFRNQLVQHAEEQEGWGWELATAPSLDLTGPGEDEVEETPKQKSKAARRKTKEGKARYQRKRARALRRQKRAQALEAGKSCAEMNVAEDSPIEDLSLTEDSEGLLTDSDYDSDDERKWVDNRRPAGRLFGKSLLDVANEKQEQRKASKNFYGKQGLEAAEAFEKASALQGGGDAQSTIAPSTKAASFKENGGAINDTRERMQATFGFDSNWAREMLKRRELDAIEAQEEELKRLAEEEYEKEREEKKKRRADGKAKKGIFRRGKKVREAAVSPQQPIATVDTRQEPVQDSMLLSANGVPLQPDEAAIEAPGQAEDFNDTGDTVVAEKASLKQAHIPTSPPRLLLGLDIDPSPAEQPSADGNGTALDSVRFPPAKDSDQEDSDSEDEADKWKRAMHRASVRLSLHGGLGDLALPNGADQQAPDAVQDSDDDDVPLEQVKRKSSNIAMLAQAPQTESDSDDDVPLNQIKSKRSLAVVSPVAPYDSVDSQTMRIANAAFESPSSITVPLQPLTGGLSSLRKSNQAVSRSDFDEASSSEEEEIPLAQLRARKSAAQVTVLVSSPDKGNESMQTIRPGITPIQRNGEDDDDDDRPLGLRHSSASLMNLRQRRLSMLPSLTSSTPQQQRIKQPRLSVRTGYRSSSSFNIDHINEDTEDIDDDQDEDDRPLGASHPEAIIAQQAATIQRLQSENALHVLNHQAAAAWSGLYGNGGSRHPSMMFSGPGGTQGLQQRHCMMFPPVGGGTPFMPSSTSATWGSSLPLPAGQQGGHQSSSMFTSPSTPFLR